jgi:alkylated DNA repair dioxygenase AlkB
MYHIISTLDVEDSHFIGIIAKPTDSNDFEQIKLQIISDYKHCSHIPYIYITNDKEIIFDLGAEPKQIKKAFEQVVKNLNDSSCAIFITRDFGGKLLGLSRLIACYERLVYCAMIAIRNDKKLFTRTFDITNLPVYGLGQGDSYIIPNFISEQDYAIYFDKLNLNNPNCEINYETYSNEKGQKLPRLNSIQSIFYGDNSFSIYRYPGNDTGLSIKTYPMSPTIDQIRINVENAIKQELNNCVINCYRNGKDYIGPHKDKMLDIKTDSTIVSVSLGPPNQSIGRIMSLICDDGFQVQKFVLPPNSMFVLGKETNKFWKHSIEKEPDNGQMRISLTYRLMASFIKDGHIIGQGEEKTS